MSKSSSVIKVAVLLMLLGAQTTHAQLSEECKEKAEQLRDQIVADKDRRASEIYARFLDLLPASARQTYEEVKAKGLQALKDSERLRAEVSEMQQYGPGSAKERALSDRYVAKEREFRDAVRTYGQLLDGVFLGLKRREFNAIIEEAKKEGFSFQSSFNNGAVTVQYQLNYDDERKMYIHRNLTFESLGTKSGALRAAKDLNSRGWWGDAIFFIAHTPVCFPNPAAEFKTVSADESASVSALVASMTGSRAGGAPRAQSGPRASN